MTLTSSILMEMSTFLYKMACQTSDLRHKKYLLEEARKLAKEQLADRDNRILYLEQAVVRMAQDIDFKEMEIEAQEQEIGRLNTILRVSFSELASEKI